MPKPTLVPIFVDTNVLIYAHDGRDVIKQQAAQAWLTRCWRERSGRVSVQVLNEFYVNVVRIVGERFKAQARSEIRHLLVWQPWAIDTATLETAWSVADDASISHWDSLIVAAAIHQGCELLLSEDMQHARVIEGVKIVNPFF